MPKIDFENRFKEIMVQEAARERRLWGVTEWMIRGSTELVPEEFLDQVDEAELAADLADYYGLEPEEVKRAEDICEDLVSKGVPYGG